MISAARKQLRKKGFCSTAHIDLILQKLFIFNFLSIKIPHLHFKKYGGKGAAAIVEKIDNYNTRS